MSDSDRKRASLFEDGRSSNIDLKLERFTPKKPKEIDTRAVENISEQEGFTTKHANKSPKRDGRRLKKSARTTQFNVRLKPHTAEDFWQGAEYMGMEYADDFLEYLLKLHKANESS